MSYNLTGQLLVARTVEYDAENKTFSVTGTMNFYSVEVFPSVVITDVLIKILFPNYINEKDAYIEILDKQMNVITLFTLPKIINMRDEKMTPGLDTFINIRFPVTEEGEYIYRLRINGKKVFDYPLFIRHLKG
ncbi:hypothetical protein ACWGPW_25475 [Paenibacillus chitinolyticus]